jgi:hypothetical protein
MGKVPAMRTPEGIGDKSYKALFDFTSTSHCFTMNFLRAMLKFPPNSGVKTSEPPPQRPRVWVKLSFGEFSPPLQASNQSLFLWVKLVKSPMIHTDATHKPPDSSADDT